MENDYMNIIKEHIELDKLLASTKPEYHELIKQLIEKKHSIMQKNGFFAGFQINRINKKIEKIKKKSYSSK